MPTKKPKKQAHRPANPDAPGAVRLRNVIAHLTAAKLVESQKDFGEKIGYNESYLSQLVNGAVPVNLRLAKRVYDMFGVNVEYLLDGKGGEFTSITDTVVPAALMAKDKNITHISDEFLGAFYRDEMNTIIKTGKSAEKWHYPGLPESDHFFSMYVNDDKMTGIYSAGSIVVLREVFNPQMCVPGKDYLFIWSGRGLLARYEGMDSEGGSITFVQADGVEKELAVSAIMKVYAVHSCILRR